MKFKLTTVLPDKLAQAPPIEVEIHGDFGRLTDVLLDELLDDRGDPQPVGTVVTVTVERVA